MALDRVFRYLSELENEGATLLKEQQQGSTVNFSGEHLARIQAWRAACLESLKVALPASSELLAEFTKVWSDEAQDIPAVRERVEATLPILSKAQAVGPLRPQDKEYYSEVEREVRLLIGNVLPKTPWFYVPLTALVAAFGFAALGIVQVQNLRLDVRDQAADAVQRARTQIDSVSDLARSNILQYGREADQLLIDARNEVGGRIDDQLAAHVNAERARITNEANQRLSALLEQSAPGLNQRVDSLRAETSRVEGRVELTRDRLVAVDSAVSRLTTDVGNLEESVNRFGSSEELALLRQAATSLRVTRLQAAIAIGALILLVLDALATGYLWHQLRRIRAARA